MPKDSQAEAFVRFNRVQKSYDGETLVVKDLNLEIPKGEFLTMLGPSGSGKTTVLRVLMTLEKINGGVIHLDGETLTHMNLNGKQVEADIDDLNTFQEFESKLGDIHTDIKFIKENLFNPETGLWAETKQNTAFRKNTTMWRGIIGGGVIAALVESFWGMFTK